MLHCTCEYYIILGDQRYFLDPEYIIPWTTKVNQGGINLTFINNDDVGRAESNCWPLPTVKFI